MKTRALRLHGKDDLRLDEFELPKIKDDEILAKVVCDSICMSSYKAAHQADTHKRVPRDIDRKPIIIGHEFAGEIVEVGKAWQDKFKAGEKFSIQPALNYPDGPIGVQGALGYTYEFCGGDATYVIIPKEVMLQGCLLSFKGEGFYPGALSEPLSCVIGAMHSCYHTTPGSYEHKMEIKDGGNMAILAGVGPMGLAAINYVLHRKDIKPRLFVVTDINQERLDRAASLYTVEFAASRGIDLRYVNTGNMEDPAAELRAMTGGVGFDDVHVMAPVPSVIKQGDDILAFDGCFNFFSGPAKSPLDAAVNFYDIHYAAHHFIGSNGGNTADMKEALDMMADDMDPAGLVTHVGGLDVAGETTLNLASIPGGKKLIYTHIDMPLTAIADFAQKGETNPVYAELARLCDAHGGLWNVEAENYLLSNPGNLY